MKTILDRARRRLARQDYAGAVREANRAVMLRPGDRRLYRLRAEMIRRLKRACRSPEGLETVVRADPNLVWFYNERFEAQCCWGRFGKVLKSLDEEIAQDPQNARALALRGEVLRMPAFCRFSEGLDSLERAARLEPRRAWIAAFLGRARVHMGQRRRGIADLRRAAALDPSCAWIQAWLGEAFFNRGRHADALSALRHAIALNPECALAHSWRGAALQELGRHKAAVKDLTRALELHRRYAEVYVWPSQSTRDWEELVRIDLYGLSLERGFVYCRRARARAGLGDWDGAVADMAEALRLDPKYHWVEGRGTPAALKAVLEGLGQALRKNPRRAWTWAWRGEILIRLQDYPRALEALDRSAALDPGNAWALAWRAQARLQIGWDDLARRDCEGAIRLDKACLVPHAVLAQIHQNAGRPGAARRALDRLLRRDPKLAWALCWRGEVRLRLRDPKGALEDLDRAVALHPGYADGYFWRAEAKRALGLAPQARADLERTLSLRPDHALAYLSRGLVRGQLGDARGRLSDFARAGRLRPDLLAQVAPAKGAPAPAPLRCGSAG